jgi:hypothetical protein
VHALIIWLVARACEVIWWLASINLGKRWPDTRAHSWVRGLIPGPIFVLQSAAVHRAHTCMALLITGLTKESANWFQSLHTCIDQSPYLYRPFDIWTYKRISWADWFQGPHTWTAWDDRTCKWTGRLITPRTMISWLMPGLVQYRLTDVGPVLWPGDLVQCLCSSDHPTIVRWPVILPSGETGSAHWEHFNKKNIVFFFAIPRSNALIIRTYIEGTPVHVPLF